MYRTLLHRLPFIWLATLISAPALAQNLSGIWRGYFITDQFEQYKFEVQIEQIGSTVQGVSYSYLNTVFYGKAAIRGNYESAGKQLRLEETRTIELKMSDGSHSCIMDCDLVFNRSGREEFLEGTYGSRFEKNAPGVRKGADCGDGKVYLRRVTESDFYLEPFLKKQARNKPVYDNQAPPGRNRINPPTPTRSIQSNNPIPPAETNSTKASLVPETSKSIPAPPPSNSNLEVRPEVLKSRINELHQELVVKDRSIRIRFYDNGEIDGDSISVYLGNKLVLAQQKLTAAPLEVRFEIPERQEAQEMTMVAENLGTIPPNTSLMIVESGGERFEIRLTSTEKKNAVVRFRYRPE